MGSIARLAVLVPFVAATLLTATPSPADPDLTIDPGAWKVVKSESGPVDYYSVKTEGTTRFIRAQYVPPMKTTVLGFQIPDADRQRAKKLRWTWRALTLPVNGDECSPRHADSAAVVYVTWKRGLRYYTLKYVWSAVGKKGSVCDSRRNPFVAQDTIIVESGGPVGEWRPVEIDLAQHYRHHFEHDDPNAAVPDLVGVAIMSDGDQTSSPSAADYGTFIIVR